MMQDKVYSNPYPITIDDLKRVCSSFEVDLLVSKIRAAFAAGDDNLRRELKKQLPAFPAHACGMSGDGTRCAKNALTRKIIGVDVDHVPNPIELYHTNIEQKIQELLIAFVQVSPSGDGLHILACRHDDETIPAAQQRITAAIGCPMSNDEKAKDPSRAFFVGLWREVLYINPAAFLFPSVAVKQERIAHFTALDGQNPVYAAHNMAVPLSQAERKIEENKEEGDGFSTIVSEQETPNAPTALPSGVKYTAAPAPAVTVPTEYRGIPMRTIIDTRLRQLGVVREDGNVYEGNRNDGLKRLSDDMYHILDTPRLNGAVTRTANVPALRAILAAAPYHNLQLSQNEVDSLLASSAKWYLNGKDGNGAYMSTEFRNMLLELEIQAKINKQVEQQLADAEEGTQTGIITPVRPTYPLPDYLQWLTARMPSHEFVDLACEQLFPAIGALGSNYRLNYWFDGEPHSLSLTTLIVGKASKGKSLLIKAVEEAIMPLREADSKAQDALDIYERELEQYNRIGGTIPERPEATTRVCGSVISRSALLKKMKAAKNKIILQVSEDFGENIVNNKKDYAPPTHVYNRSFDNSIVNGDFIGTEYNVGNIRAFLNGTYTGQMECMLYLTGKDGENLKNGLGSRWYVDELPEEGLRAKRIRPYSASEKTLIRKMSEQLMAAQPTTLYYPFADDAAEAWWGKIEQLYMQTLSPTLDYVHNRDAVMLTRIMYMLAVLYGIKSYIPGEPARTAPEEQEKEQAVIAWGTYFAERLILKQLKFFGGVLEQTDTLQYLPPKLTDVYTQLPDEFTRHEFIALLNNTQKQNISRHIDDWLSTGYIERIGRGQYHKLKQNRTKSDK